MNDQEIIITRELDASPEQVWKAITDKEQMRRWYFDLAEFKAEVGFKFQFSGGPSPERQYLHLCEVTEVIPNKKLTYSWRYDGYAGNSFVTFELSSQGNKTFLNFKHTGLESFPKDNPDFAIGNFTEGWNHIIHKALKDYVENVDKEIYSSRTFNAPRDLVWEVWTNPNHAALWWGPSGFTNTIYEMNVKPGGIFKLMMHGPDGVDYPNQISYIEVVKPERLVYNHGNYENPEMFFVTINFLEDNGKTKITMRMLFKTVDARREVVEKYGALEGQKQHLDKLDAYLAKLQETEK
jgi:uncharacterized protein YndB with AHSA1/START domain